MGIYGAIFKKIAGAVSTDKKSKTKKRKKMAKTKLTPEQKQARRAKILGGLKKVSGAVQKYSGGKPTVRVKPAPVQKQQTAPATSFWTDKIDMGFIKPTGTQAVIGGTIILGVGAFVVSKLRR